MGRVADELCGRAGASDRIGVPGCMLPAVGLDEEEMIGNARDTLTEAVAAREL